MKKKEGVLIVRDERTNKTVYIDKLEVRGVAKDYERGGAAIVLLGEKGNLPVIESFEAVRANLYED